MILQLKVNPFFMYVHWLVFNEEIKYDKEYSDRLV